MEKRDEAIGDSIALIMAVAGATQPTEVVDRLTSFLAGRLNAQECLCLVIDGNSDNLALVCASDAYDKDHRGTRIPGDQASQSVHYLLDRALDWSRHGLVSRIEDSGMTGSDRPLPIVRGALIKEGSEFSGLGRQAGLIVPIVFQRRIVGLQWVGGLSGERPGDWALTLVQSVAALLGQAFGALGREREQLEVSRGKDLEYQAEIARLEKANEKLRAMFRDRNKALAMSAHEFKVPINIIQGHLSTLRNLTSLTDTQRTTATAIHKQCEHLMSLIDDTLIARHREKLSLKLEPCDLTPLMRAWAEEYSRLCNRSSTKIEIKVDPDMGIRRIDPRRLNTMITTLLEGTLKHTAGKATLFLEVGIQGDNQLHIRLSDDPSAAFTESTSEEIPYTALGLVEVKELTDLHGGQLTIHQHVDQAMQYTVLLPAHLDETASEDTNPLPAKTGRILVIDPDKEALYHIASSLALHFEVLTARTEREAFWLLQQFPIDCAIVDLNYPLMTGFATAAELRKDPRRTRLPVLFTADVDPQGLPLRRHGELIEDVIVKPIDGEELFARIKRSLSELREQKALEVSTRMDTLTGLMSRSTAARELEAQVERNTGRQSFLTILLIDVDGMVEINKRHGRGIGNELIHEMGKTLNSVTRSQEFTARWGGDEFLCILPGTSQPSGKSAGERLKERLSRCTAESTSTTVSIGGATLDPRNPIKALDLLNRAETALRAAKALGGNKVIIWKDSSSSTSAPSSIDTSDR